VCNGLLDPVLSFNLIKRGLHYAGTQAVKTTELGIGPQKILMLFVSAYTGHENRYTARS
jgi:hypothetical protein